MATTNGERRTILGRETLIPVGVAASMMLTLWLAASWVRDNLADVSYSLRDVRREIELLSQRMQGIDTGSKAELRRFAEILAARNPTLIVPEVK